jgi:hypothetical protein
MKRSATNTLITAKTMLNLASQSIVSGDKHSCTSGLIMLQDGVELIVLAALDEMDTDEQRSLESKSFDELLGVLKKQGALLVKTGTIKALNKQRVLSKHYGQLVEPATAANYLQSAQFFVDTLVKDVSGKILQEIFLVDLLNDSPAKDHLVEASRLADKGNYLEGLIEIRKAFYVAYEKEYCIYKWKDPQENVGILYSFFLGGGKAPYWTRSSKWIQENIKKPTDYVQINYDQIKIDCMEYGVSTVDIDNLRRLTPEVVETEAGKWHIDYEFPANEGNKANFNQCMDIAIDFLRRMQEFRARIRSPKRDVFAEAPTIYIGKQVFDAPSTESKVIHVVEAGWFYRVERLVTGFNPDQRFLYIHLYQTNEEGKEINHIWGYLLDEIT